MKLVSSVSTRSVYSLLSLIDPLTTEYRYTVASVIRHITTAKKQSLFLIVLYRVRRKDCDELEIRYNESMERLQNILVEYEDGSLQWIKGTTEKEVMALSGFRRIRSFCNTNFRVPTERYRVGPSEFMKSVVSCES